MGRVAGIIAHEINNPLESVTNTFYLLREHPSLDDTDSLRAIYAKLGEEELARVSHYTANPRLLSGIEASCEVSS